MFVETTNNYYYVEVKINIPRENKHEKALCVFCYNPNHRNNNRIIQHKNKLLDTVSVDVFPD